LLTHPTLDLLNQLGLNGMANGLCRHSNQSLSATGNSAGKGFGEVRDSAGFFGDTCRFRAVETARSSASGGKATEGQRPFRRRQETRIAQDCVVELAGLEPANKQLCTAIEKRFAEAGSVRESEHLMLA
jgi:hypothetical protein